jgi:hypothetical protein
MYPAPRFRQPKLDRSSVMACCLLVHSQSITSLRHSNMISIVFLNVPEYNALSIAAMTCLVICCGKQYLHLTPCFWPGEFYAYCSLEYLARSSRSLQVLEYAVTWILSYVIEIRPDRERRAASNPGNCVVGCSADQQPW